MFEIFLECGWKRDIRSKGVCVSEVFISENRFTGRYHSPVS